MKRERMSRISVSGFFVVLVGMMLVVAIMNSDAYNPSDVKRDVSSGKIKHVVVLMLENHSFDHILGFLKKQNPEIDGLFGNESNPLNPLDPNSRRIKVSADCPLVTETDPSHSVPSTTKQIFGYQNKTDPAPMSGFVYSYFQDGDTSSNGTDIMKMYDSNSQLPVLSTLALEYVTFDGWFSSIPGPTWPNRLFSISATSLGSTDNNIPEFAIGYPQETLFDSFYESGYSWRDYWLDFPSLVVLRNLRDPIYVDNYREFSEFTTDVANGDLATYTWVEPRWFDFLDWPATDQHPPHNVSLGEWQIQMVYEALRNSPKWNETLLIITYDEHGGFFDHVSPPQKGVPKPDDNTPPFYEPPFEFERLGLRVPTVMISPWVQKGQVVHDTGSGSRYEHSSVAGTMKEMFGLKNYLTKRDAWAEKFDQVLFNNEQKEPRVDCVKRIEGSWRGAYSQWVEKENAGVSEELLEKSKYMSGEGSAELTNLQKEVIAMARGLALDMNDGIAVEDYKEGGRLNNEFEGGSYVQRITKKWLKYNKSQNQ